MTESHTQHPLLTPFQLGPYELRNRMVMAPMTRNRAVEGLVPAPIAATYYQQRASAGLIVTEGSQVSDQGVGYPNTPGIHSASQVEGWKKVTAAVHERGGRIFLQLWHVGRISHPSLQPAGALPVAPSIKELKIHRAAKSRSWPLPKNAFRHTTASQVHPSIGCIALRSGVQTVTQQPVTLAKVESTWHSGFQVPQASTTSTSLRAP